MLLTAIALSLVVGILLGLLGGGGSILMVPVLVYLLGQGPKEAIATSLVVVGVTAAVSAVQHARKGNVQWRIGLLFSAGGMVGAYTAGYAAAWFSGTALLLLFAAMMVATSVAMLVGRRTVESEGSGERQATWKILAEGLVVGAITGLVGAGGGFLVVPALLLLGGLPMKQAVGTSLLVIALKSTAGFLGHATHAAIDVELAAVVTISAVTGSFIGTWLSSQVPSASLRRGFGGFVLLMAGFLLYREAPAALVEALIAVPVGGWIVGALAVAALLVAWRSSLRRRYRMAAGMTAGT